MQQNRDQTSRNLNNMRIFHNQDRNCVDDEEKDNVLDRSGLFDELVCQILDDGSAPVEDEKSTRSLFMDVANAKEFVPSCPPWSYGNIPNNSTDVSRSAAFNNSQNVNNQSSSLQNMQCRGKHIGLTSSGKVINPPPGFEQMPNSNINDQPQVIPQNANFHKPAPISDIERQITTLSSNMFPGNQSPRSIHSNSSDHLVKPFPQDSDVGFQPRLPFNPNQVAQSLLQRRASSSSPMQLLLSDAGSGSPPGSIDSPILSPSSGMSSSNPPSPFETGSSCSDNALTPTRFNFKAPPFVPCRSPLGWKGTDNNPFKVPHPRSESPVDHRPFNNMSMDPPPANRMLRGNFPMQPLPLPPSGRSFSPQNSYGNYQHKDASSIYNSNSGRSSPYNFPNQQQQPAMGPYGDSLNNMTRYNQRQGPFGNLNQQGFPRGISGFPNGFPNKFPHNAGAAFSLHQQRLQQQQQQMVVETPTTRLHSQLDECCIHVKRLEEERKKTEYELAQMHPGKRISSSNTIQAPQLPDNPSQVDRIIVDVYKEHSRLVTLMSKIEGLCTKSLHPNLEACLDAWMTSIQDAEKRRQQEIRNATRRHQERSSPSTMNDEEVTQLADGIKKMKTATRAARTTLWCAFQMAKQDIREKENKSSVREN